MLHCILIITPTSVRSHSGYIQMLGEEDIVVKFKIMMRMKSMHNYWVHVIAYSNILQTLLSGPFYMYVLVTT